MTLSRSLTTGIQTSTKSAQAAIYHKCHTRSLHTLPVVSKCPEPTCSCAATPSNLNIERTKPLNGTVAPYKHHVLVCTGKSDWTSKIEDEKDHAVWGQFVVDLKEVVGPKGRFHDPYNNVLVSASSFSTMSDASTQQSPNTIGNVIMFPSFKYLSGVPLNKKSVSLMVQEFFLSQNNMQRKDSTLGGLSDGSKFQEILGKHVADVGIPTVLICSHNSRDSRCGILGPLLQDEFAKQLTNYGIPFSTDNFIPDLHPSKNTAKVNSRISPVNIGCISHVGGHAWAGNVIIYIPPGLHIGGRAHALNGMGIWYGRVEPKHVEGIIHETLLNGRVITDMFRGGINQQGEPLRL